MKVCHLTSVHKQEDVRIFHKECSSLAKVHEVFLVTPGSEIYTKNGVTIMGAGENPSSRYQRMTELAKKVVEMGIETGAEIFHLHDAELLLYLPKLKKNGRVIYDAHEDLPRTIEDKPWIKSYIRKPAALFSEIAENYFARKADSVIGATPFITKRFSKINPRSYNINNYPLRAEIGNFQTISKPQNRTIIFAGGISRIRGIIPLVEACEFIKKGKLILAGEFESEEFKREVESLSGWKNVEYVGNLTRTELFERMSMASAGVVTFLPASNHINAQPNKMFEYMASGLPVIASHFSLWKEIIEGNQCGICVPPESPKEISKAINTLLENEEEGQEMGLNGRKAVELKFNWDQEEKKLFEIYERLNFSPR